MFAGALTERFSKHRNVVSEIAVFDKAVGPDMFHQVVFVDDLAAAFYQFKQDVKRFRSDLDEFSVTPQPPPRGVEVVWTETISLLRSLTHWLSGNLRGPKSPISCLKTSAEPSQ